MIPGYDFYAEEEGPSPYRWVAEFPDGRRYREAPAGPFRDDADAAAQLRSRRRAWGGYVVRLLKNGQEWEPTA